MWLPATLLTIAVLVMFLVAVAGLQILSYIRAYTNGEALWTKGQKRAARELIEYAYSSDEAHYRAFHESLRVPLGDRKARLELLKPSPDYAVARRGFREGQNDEDDIPGMIFLFRRFGWLPQVREALEIWARGDQGIDALVSLGRTVQAESRNGSFTEARRKLRVHQIEAVDDNLTELEVAFSRSLGDLARSVTAGFFGVIGGSAILCCVVTLFGASRTIRSLVASDMRRRMSETTQRLVTDAATDSMVGIDDHGIIQWANPAVRAMFGYGPDELKGQPVTLLMGSHDASRHRAALHRYVQTGNATMDWSGIDLQAVRKDGSPLAVEVSFGEAEGPDGRRIFTGILRDASRTKRMERLIREISATVGATTGQTFLQSLAEGLARELGVSCAFIGERLESAMVRVRAFAGPEFNGFEDYPVTSTPSEVVMRDGSLWRSQGIAQEFPEDTHLVAHGAVGYAGAALRDTSGEVLGVLSVMSREPLRDRTATESVLRIYAQRVAAELQRERADRAIRESEERYRLIVENVDYAIVMLDPGGCVATWNLGAEAMNGYSSSEIVGRPLAVFHTEEDRASGVAEQALATARETGRWDATLWQVRRDGSRYFAEVHIRRLLDEHGALLGFAKIKRDISDRRRAEAELRASEERYAIVARATGDAIWDWNLRNGHVQWNGGLQELFGLIEEEDDGRASASMWLARIHPGDATRVQQELAQVIDGSGHPWLGEYRFIRSNGTFAYVSDRGYVLRDAEGRAVRMIGSVSDVTERKHAEALHSMQLAVTGILGRTRTFDEAMMEIFPVLCSTLNFQLAGASVVGGSAPFIQYSVDAVAPPAPSSLREQLRTAAVQEERAHFFNLTEDAESLDAPHVQFLWGVAFPVQEWKPLVIELFSRHCIEPRESLLEVLTDVGRQISHFIHRVEAESRLRESEEQFKTAFGSAPNGMALVSLNGDLLEVNRAYSEMYGYPPEELISRRLFELTDAADLEIAQAAFQLVVQENAPKSTHEQRYVGKGASAGWASIEIAAVRRNDGTTSHLIVQATDITVQKLTFEEQQRLNEMIRSASHEWLLTFDTVSTPIVMTDREGRIVRLNRAACLLAERDYASILGTPIDSLGSNEPWQAAAQLLTQVSGAAEPSGSRSVVDSGGRHWDVIASRAAVDAYDPDRVVFVLWETTRMVELQESLRRSETLTAMGSLVAGVAHEVRNPLFGISATVDALEARSDGQFTRQIARLRTEVDRMNRVMSELLEYARPRPAQIRHETVATVIEQATRSCAPRAEQNGIRIQTRVEAGLPGFLMDAERLQQVFQNLVENSMQHSSTGDTICVEASAFERDGRAWVRCVVRDEGTGFRAEDLERLFEPFYTRRRGGTGLGLSIVQRVIAEHHGTIHASNDGGAVMTIELPMTGDRSAATELLLHQPG